jgi:1-pyrroline-5-carboxylate dehydrogenase
MAFRVTYATLSADSDEIHGAFEAGIAEVEPTLGATHGSIVSGMERAEWEADEERSPIDTSILIGRFVPARAADVADAVSAAKAFAPTWAATPWPERARLLDAGAELISERRNRISALLTLEVGKNRLESLGDVEETADLIRYYTHQLAEHDGFEQPMGRLNPAEATYDVMRPYGVWAVIAPFNFPAALAGGPAGAALAAGNTVVIKPPAQGVGTTLEIVRCLLDAGVPGDALHVVVGGDEVGKALAADARVDGLTFTGSYEVGMQLHGRGGSAYPKPVVCEMGGKNPVIVSRHADLDLAAEGTARSAFGLSGQKCSAASRAYVERPVADAFIERLVARAEAITPADPRARDTYLGPVIDAAAVERFHRAVAEAATRGDVLAGGRVANDGDLARGHFVEPTVVRVPRDSWVMSTELFVPLVAVDVVDSLDEAIALANDTPLGLTAGFFSKDRAEIEHFLDSVEAGVVYVNRKAGATTGAWPGVQPFGGWKGSGSGGKAGGGPYYLQQYLREQSRTIVATEPRTESMEDA